MLAETVCDGKNSCQLLKAIKIKCFKTWICETQKEQILRQRKFLFLPKPHFRRQLMFARLCGFIIIYFVCLFSSGSYLMDAGGIENKNQKSESNLLFWIIYQLLNTFFLMYLVLVDSTFFSSGSSSYLLYLFLGTTFFCGLCLLKACWKCLVSYCFHCYTF